MSHEKPGRLAPFAALLLAGGGLAAMVLAPAWLPAVAVAAVALLGGSAMVARRRSRGLVVAVAAAALLLTVGLAGAWLLRARPIGGLGWTLLVLFALPLPLVPWLYWLTFENGFRGPGSGVRGESSSIVRTRQLTRESPGNETATTTQGGAPHPETGSRTPVPRRSGPDHGPRTPHPGRVGGE